MIKLLEVSHNQLFFSTKSKRYLSRGAFTTWHNPYFKYVDEFHVLAPILKVVASPKGSTYLDARVRIHKPAKHYDFVNFGLITNIFLTAWVCKKHGIDVVVCRVPSYDGLPGVIGAFLVWKKRILEICGDWSISTDLRKPAFGFLTKFLTKVVLVLACHLSNKIIVRNHEMKEKLINLGIAPNKIGIIPGTTLDFSFFAIPKLRVGKKMKTAIFIGRLAAEKGLFDLIQSANLVRNEYTVKNFRLKIVGDGPLRADLERKVNDLKLDDVVSFTGYVPHDEINKHLTEAWVFVLPSLTEGVPKAILEAMAAGRPIVATKVGGIPDIVENGVDGLLIEPNNPKALAHGIHQILTNEHGAIDMGKKGRKKAKRYSMERIQRKYFTLIKDQLG